MPDELIAGARTEEEVTGPGGLLGRLTRRLAERAMEVELTDYLGCEPDQEPPGGTGNTRNGSTPKTPVTDTLDEMSRLKSAANPADEPAAASR